MSDNRDKIISTQMDVIQTLIQHNLSRISDDFWGPSSAPKPAGTDAVGSANPAQSAAPASNLPPPRHWAKPRAAGTRRSARQTSSISR